jgi:membrane protease YdiL (CAAX protease family)
MPVDLFGNYRGYLFDFSSPYWYIDDPNAQLWIPICLIAPVSEEIYFRGFLFKILEGVSAWGAIFLTALAFAAAHAPVLITAEPTAVFAFLGISIS